MTQFDQSSYLPYAKTQSRPTVITVLAIVGIVFGGLGVLSGLVGLVTTTMMIMSHGVNPLAPTLPPMGKSILLYTAAITPVHLLLSVTAIIGCIGALLLKPWAYKTMIFWSIATIVLSVLTTIVQLVWVSPMTMKAISQSQAGNPMMTTTVVRSLALGGALLGLLLSCILPILFLTLWNRENVKNAFHSVSTP